MKNKLLIYTTESSEPREISFLDNDFCGKPKTLQDWSFVYMGFYLGNKSTICQVVLYFNGKRYSLGEDGWEEWV